MAIRLSSFAVAAVVGALLLAQSAHALDVPPLRGRVNDRAQIIGPATERALESRLAQYEKKTGHQFAVLTIPSLQGDPIEDFSIRVVEAWKLGSAERDDGLLLVVVPNERKMRIEVGYGLEGAIPDALSGRVIRNVMVPRFRRGDFDGGIEAAMDLLIRAAAGESVQVPQRSLSGAKPGKERPALGLNLFWVLMLLGFSPWFLFPLRRRRGYGRGFYLGGYGGGLGGGLGGGFGGGFRGGGGGFGGGGASGGW